MDKAINNLKYIILSVSISGILLSIIWFNIDYLIKLFFDIRCESFGCIGLGLWYLVVYITSVFLILLVQIIIFYKKLKKDKLKNISIIVLLTVLVSVFILSTADFINKKKEDKAILNAYYECLDFAKQTNISNSYCDIYK